MAVVASCTRQKESRLSPRTAFTSAAASDHLLARLSFCQYRAARRRNPPGSCGNCRCEELPCQVGQRAAVADDSRVCPSAHAPVRSRVCGTCRRRFPYGRERFPGGSTHSRPRPPYPWPAMRDFGRSSSREKPGELRAVSSPPHPAQSGRSPPQAVGSPPTRHSSNSLPGGA